METADSTSTLQASLQPSLPRRKYQEYPCICCCTVKFPGVPRRWKFYDCCSSNHLQALSSIFSLPLASGPLPPRRRRVFTFPLGFRSPIRCHYTPHKAARHRPGRSAARNSESLTTDVDTLHAGYRVGRVPLFLFVPGLISFRSLKIARKG